MGFCSESLLLFAAFHPGTSENDCLGDLPMIWMAALGPTPTRHFMDFFGGDQPLEWGLGGWQKLRFTPGDSVRYYFLRLGHKPKSGHNYFLSKYQNCWFQPLFLGWFFIPGRWCEKTHELVACWMVDSDVCWDEVSAIFRQEIQTTVRQLQDGTDGYRWRDWG